MQNATGSSPTLPVVTFRQAQKALTGQEALGNLIEVAQRDPDATSVQRATVAAALGHALDQLRKAENAAGALVLSAPHDGPAARLQSLIASGEKANLTLTPLETGGDEAVFDTHDWIGWATVAWEKLKHLTPHAMLRPKSAYVEPLPDAARIAVIGDWGTGLYGAPLIARSIRNDPDPFTMLLHLGDVYYSGTEEEMQSRFLNLWPYRKEAVSRGLNSNHDMYSGGEAYFGRVLPAFGQEGSYFAFQNTHWTLVGLDVAYHDHAVDDIQVAWLEEILVQAGERRVVLFSHHQLYSHFDGQGTKLRTHPRFGEILRSKRIFAWYWGHEHRCAIFEGPDPSFGLLGRCLGHGGMPQARRPTMALPQASEAAFSRAEWRRSAATTREGIALPSVVVLDGRNEFIVGEEELFSPHGYAVLTFDGPSLMEQVLDPRGAVIYERMIGR